MSSSGTMDLKPWKTHDLGRRKGPAVSPTLCRGVQVTGNWLIKK